MLVNQNYKFSDAQAITATALSTNVIKWPTQGIAPGEAAAFTRNYGPGFALPILIQVMQAFNNLTSLTVTLETADDAAITTNATVLETTGAILLASLVAGYKFPGLRYVPDARMRDYCALRYTVAGTAPTQGTITAYLATFPQAN